MESNPEFRLIYEDTKTPIFHLIRTRVGSREDALDIFQDVYVDLWEALGKGRFAYRSDPELLGFLYLIAKRRIAKFYRFRHFTVSLDDIEPAVEVESGERGEIVLALRKLGEADREVLNLRYFSGLSFKEIAVLLNKDESAIKVRHHRAMKKLKEILGYEQTT